MTKHFTAIYPREVVSTVSTYIPTVDIHLARRTVQNLAIKTNLLKVERDGWVQVAASLQARVMQLETTIERREWEAHQ